MEGISDIKIVGIDEKRPPRVRKEPYIDLFFKLSHQAPEDWCEKFNALASRLSPPAKINKSKGLFIETYVRDMNNIPEHLETVKDKITVCSAEHTERFRQRELAAAEANTALQGNQGEQGKLNAIIAELKFDD